MIQTAEFTQNEKTARDMKIALMPIVKLIPVRYDNRTTLWIKEGRSPEKAIQRIANREVTGVKRIS